MVLDWLQLNWFTGVIGVVTLVYLYLIWNYDYWKKRGIPYEKPGLIFGNYKEIILAKKAVGTLMHDIYNKQEGHSFVGLFRFRTPALLVRDPDVVKTVLVKDFPSFDRNVHSVNSELDPLWARNPFFSFGERWKVVRSLLSPTFTAGKIKPLFPIMEKAAEEFDKYIEINAPKSRPDGFEAKQLCAKYTTNVVANSAFGIEAGCFSDTESEFILMNKKMLSPDFITNARLLLCMYFPSFSRIFKLRIMPTDVAEFYRKVVKEVIAYRESNNLTRNDFLQLLMQIKEKSQEALEEKVAKREQQEYTDEDITAHAVTFITEGFETSSITMSFLFYELAMNPEAQDKLREELEEAVEKNDGKLSYDVITTLPYLNMVFTETLRMHPALMTMEKFCTKRCELPKENGGTLKVEPGTIILIPVHALQYDPKYYPEPENFDPERFSEERKDFIPKFTYLPFGEGPRICVGMRFAAAQIKTGVARIVLKYFIRPSARTPKKIVQDVNYFLAAAQGGLWLDFVKRN